MLLLIFISFKPVNRHAYGSKSAFVLGNNIVLNAAVVKVERNVFKAKSVL